MTTTNYNRKCEQIYHMNRLMRSLNDENSVMTWLQLGVPDGVFSVEQIKDTYDNDEYFEDDYNDLVRTFCEILSHETKNAKKCDGLFV